MRTGNVFPASWEALLRKAGASALVAVFLFLSSAEAGEGAYIGMERAKNIALAHAGVSESDLRKLDVEMERHRGRVIYEIEFVFQRNEHEYEIDARTGEILKWKVERD